MDLAWLACGALLWGVMVALVWGLHKLQPSVGGRS